MPEPIWVLVFSLLPGLLIFARYKQGRLFGFKKHKTLNQDYLRGLNYLLDEQTDKAIEVFTRVLEVEKDTVEIHLALGSLFRRRGEVDRSIRIHQNLIQVASLNKEQREKALLELANDYLRAGLLDRAEVLLQDLVKVESQLPQSLRALADIYEQEKDWQKAVDVMRKLARVCSENKNAVIAHYHCEMARLHMDQGEPDQTRTCLEEALRIDPRCVRASIMLGQWYLRKEQYPMAIAALEQVGAQDPAFLGEVIGPLQQSYAHTGKSETFLQYLLKMLPQFSTTQVVLMIAELMRKQQSVTAAIRFVIEQLRQKPTVRGLDWLLNVQMELSAGDNKEAFAELKALTTLMLENRPQYQCAQCGFAGGVLHWQCPGCKNWNSVKPVQWKLK